MGIVGQGVYSVADVARFTGIASQKLRRWFAEEGLLRPQHGVLDNALILSFHDLVEVLVIKQFREAGMSLQTIRKVRDRAKQITKSERPFVSDLIKTDGTTAYLLEWAKDGLRATDLSRLQHAMPNIIHGYLKSLVYDPQTHLATRWRISKNVMLDPDRGFGAPTIEGTRLKAELIAQYWRANGRNTALIASWYGLTPEQVQDAVDFDERIVSTTIPAPKREDARPETAGASWPATRTAGARNRVKRKAFAVCAKRLWTSSATL